MLNERVQTEGIEDTAQLKNKEQLRQLDERKKQADDTMKMLHEPMAKVQDINDMIKGPVNETTQRALAGDISMECPSSAKIVRIFTSSTFTGRFHNVNPYNRFLKGVSFGSKDCTKELKPECAYFQGQTS